MVITNFYFFSLTNAATPWQINFQDPATPIMEGILNFHNDLMFFGIIIFIFVCYLVIRCIISFNEIKHPISLQVIHGTFLEIIWTVIPAIILMIIAVPSFTLTYSIDEIVTPDLTIKIIGHQWYWSYEYDDAVLIEDEIVEFDSYLVPEEDLQLGQFRLLEVDNRIVLPVNKHIRILLGSTDVIHCWTIPSFGLKLDACPGRLNQTSLYIKREGVYYGQCSEICGINHGFMPIVVEAVPVEAYNDWIRTKI